MALTCPGMIFRNPNDILAWNMKVNEYIVGVFDFAQMFLAFNGAVLLFHLNDLKILKEVKSYLESYGFQTQMKWAVVNSLPFTSSEDPSFKVPFQSTKFYLYFSSFQLKFKKFFNFANSPQPCTFSCWGPQCKLLRHWVICLLLTI
jgi:hypothetical protein